MQTALHDEQYRSKPLFLIFLSMVFFGDCFISPPPFNFRKNQNSEMCTKWINVKQFIDPQTKSHFLDMSEHFLRAIESSLFMLSVVKVVHKNNYTYVI